MTNNEFVMMIGIPGCGKSTFIERFLPYHFYVNLDSTHKFLAPETGFDKKNLILARNIEKITIDDRLKNGIPFVLDNTNITTKIRSGFIEMAKSYNTNITAVYFKPDLERALLQNKQRERKVPEEKIKEMCDKFEIPSYDEGFSKIIDASNPTGLIGNKKAVFLDRDGVILVDRLNGKDHFVNHIEDIIYLDNAISGLKKMSDKGYDLFVVSNQSGIASGRMTRDELDVINQNIMSELTRNDINIKGIYICPHAVWGGCRCRKPSTGLLIQASREHDIDPTQSYMIGDMTTDVEVGSRVMSKTILVKTGFAGSDKKYMTKPTYYAKDLLQASEYIQ